MALVFGRDRTGIPEPAAFGVAGKTGALKGAPGGAPGGAPVGAVDGVPATGGPRVFTTARLFPVRKMKKSS